jgi:hypothetical protein
VIKEAVFAHVRRVSPTDVGQSFIVLERWQLMRGTICVQQLKHLMFLAAAMWRRRDFWQTRAIRNCMPRRVTTGGRED